MRNLMRRWIAILLVTAAQIAVAQQQAAPSRPAAAAPAADLEPAVDTSAVQAVKEEAAPQESPAAKPTQTKAPASTKGPAEAAKGKAHDRIELDTTQITGNRELPKVLYIVPWKRSDLSDLTGRPVNSLLDEVLTPVDRDVFKRENRYYGALKPEQRAAQAPAPPGGVEAAPKD